MGESNYLVYEVTPLGDGIAVGLFASLEMALKFMQAYIESFYAEPEISLAVRKLSVNDSTSIHRYMKSEFGEN